MSVGRLCKLFGKSRQAYYLRETFYNEQYHVGQIEMELVTQIRRDLPGLCKKKTSLDFKRAIQNTWY